MGTLTYDGGTPIKFEDRTLAHLQVVIGAKLRRGESCYFSWPAPEGGRTTIWMHPTLSLRYDYAANEMPVLNRAWIERLTQSSFGPGGLVLVDEPEAIDELAHQKAPEGEHKVPERERDVRVRVPVASR
nr:ATP-dependent DNA ligase [Mycetocola zhujimingii]